jgi:hypothetical protein
VFLICIFLCFISLNYFLRTLCFCSLIFVKLVFPIMHCIASYGKFTSWFMSNDPKKFIIPIFISKYHKLKRKRGSDRLRQPGGPSGLTRRTVRGYPTDCLHGSKGCGELLDALVLILDRPRRGPGPSERLVDCPHVRRGLSACATCRWSRGHELLSQQATISLLKPQRPLSTSLSLALSHGRTPLFGILIGALPGPSEHIHGLSVRFSTMSSGYFFE